MTLPKRPPGAYPPEMAETTKPAALAAVQGVIAIVGAVTLIAGIINKSVVAAANITGVIGLFGLVAGCSTWTNADKADVRKRIRTTCIAVAVACAVAGIAFLAGRPLDATEKRPNLLTAIGAAAIIAPALLVTVAWREINKLPEVAQKKCPDCAHMVLAEARKCEYCSYRFDAAS
jgi:hypothetical protein